MATQFNRPPLRKITDFKSKLTGGGARPNLFEVELAFPEAIQIDNDIKDKSRFLVKAAALPASNITPIDVNFRGRILKIAGDRTFDTWTITVLNDVDFSIRSAFEKWMNLISTHILNTRKEFSTAEGQNADYKQTIKVSQYNKKGEHAHHYHFYGAFPSALSSIALDWGTQEIEEYTCTWTYDHWLPGGLVPSPRSNSPHLFPNDQHR